MGEHTRREGFSRRLTRCNIREKTLYMGCKLQDMLGGSGPEYQTVARIAEAWFNGVILQPQKIRVNN